MNLEDVSKEQIEEFRSLLLSQGVRFYRPFPWRSASNRWHALVAEIMLQRTRAEQVEPVYRDFTERYPTPADYAADTDARVFVNLGLHWREKWLRLLAEALSTRAEFPSTADEFINLPGVGSYVSAAMLSLHLGVRAVIIDANIVRLYGRYFGFATDGETRRKRWFVELSEMLTPHEGFREYNYALLDFTREICKPAPNCAACALRVACQFGAPDNP